MKLVLITTAALLCTPLVMAQGHGAQNRGGQGMGRPSMTQPQMQGQGQRGNTPGIGIQDRDRDRLRIHATDQQRQQLRDCTGSAKQVRKQAKNMKKATKGKNFDRTSALQQRDRLQERLQIMNQQHQRLMQGLTTEQQAALQERIRNMDQIHERLNSRMQEMNNELEKPAPEQNRLQQMSTDLEREMEQMEEEYRLMNGRIG